MWPYGNGIGILIVGTVEDGSGTFELITPSSSLINLQGLDGADVPWFEKFTGLLNLQQ